MTTVAYCAVSDDGRTFADQLTLKSASHEALRKLTTAVHAAGAAASLQLGHCGFFTKLGPASGPPRSASRSFNAYGALRGLAFSRSMNRDEIQRVVDEFVNSARTAIELDFDAVELGPAPAGRPVRPDPAGRPGRGSGSLVRSGPGLGPY